MRAFLLAAATLALAAGTASAGGPRMVVGAVEQTLMEQTPDGTAATFGLLTQAGLGGATRVALTWTRGETAPGAEIVGRLDAVVSAAAKAGTAVYASVYPSGSSQTPLTDTDQAAFASWVAALSRAVPQERHWIVGNEPNLNRFWLPQFGPAGEDVAAPAYVSLLARTYDALKDVTPSNQVLGGALSHAGVDRPGTGRDTHSPTAFVLDMGAAYRASGRDRPIMDAFAFHPYLLDSNEPPTLQHPSSTTITIADYGKLVALLGQAFDGTAQPGSQLPIVYAEFGVQTTPPAEKLGLYTGREPATVHPVDEATQARYYADALQLAFCQPTVTAFLLYSLIDERNLAGWQSGVYYVDRTAKTSLGPVRDAALAARRNALVSCAGLQVTPRPRAVWFPGGIPGPGAGRFPVVITCDVDCTYRLRLEKVSTHSTTLERYGRATGRAPARVELGPARLAPGTYRYTLRVDAILNRGPGTSLRSPPFTVDPEPAR